MIRQGETRAKRIALWCMALGILIPGGYGFTEKLIQFVRTLHTEEGAGFTIIPISNYFLIAAGMACLLGWAVIHGMFRDVEGPKYKMLEREAELDRLDGHVWKESE